eukprot:XP_002595094.1 hypothetical protein BRAFLDRAFT_90204 [Branchiostoma floridae]
MRSQEERHKTADQVWKRLEDYKKITDNVIEELTSKLLRATTDAVQLLKTHLQSDKTRAIIVKGVLKEVPSLRSIKTHDSLLDQAARLVRLHIEGAIRRWFSYQRDQQYFCKIEADLITDFKDRLNLIEKIHDQEIDQALNADLPFTHAALSQNTRSGDEDFNVWEKMILGFSAPLWVPVGLVIGVLVGLPIWGVMTVHDNMTKGAAKRASDTEFMKAYNEDKVGYITVITNETVDNFCQKDKLKDYINDVLQKPRECLTKLEHAIPKIEKADRQMIEALRNEDRKENDLRGIYEPQFEQCKALQCKLAFFNLRRLGQIEYNLDDLLASMPRKIGSGGFGQVYKVQIKSQGSLKEAALKIEKEAITEKNVIKFHDEEECLRYLEDPHIVDYYGLAKAPHLESCGLRLGVLMEFCPYTLHDWLNSHKEQTPAWWPDDEAKMKEGFNTVKDLASQLCLGLKAIHEKGYMHRDLKLENVLVTEEGVVKIADMGLAKRLDEVTGTMVGTPLYAAPEVFNGREHYDISADIYSLGFCLLEMWYGSSVTEDKEYICKVFNPSTLQGSINPPIKLPIPNTLPPCSGWVDLMKDCWKDPKFRPSASHCVQLMSRMKL